jgi:PilZ domain
MSKERRSGDDRRHAERFPVSIEVEWEGMVGRKPGVINDISTQGCFVLCSGEVDDGENVKILFPMPSGKKLQLWGEVVNHVFEIGFGIRFIELSEGQRDFLEKFIDTLRDD